MFKLLGFVIIFVAFLFLYKIGQTYYEMDEIEKAIYMTLYRNSFYIKVGLSMFLVILGLAPFATDKKLVLKKSY